MKNDRLLTTFHYLSYGVIILPIIIILAAVVSKFYQKPRPTTSSKIVSPKINPPISIQPTITPAAQVRIDFAGPWHCQKDGVEISVKNRNIYASTSTDNYLLQGDCLYIWGHKQYTGEKICGLSPYLSVLESIGQVGLINQQTLLKTASDLLGADQVASQADSFFNVLSSCQKQSVQDSVFQLPRQVLFKNKE